MLTHEGILACHVLIAESTDIAPPYGDDDEAMERMFDAWKLILSDLDDARLLELTVAWLRGPDVKYNRWPSPGALLHAMPAPEDVDDADHVWGHLLQVVPSRGYYNPPEGPDDLRLADPDQAMAAWEALRSVGGARGLCVLQDDQIPAARASFRAAYRGLRQRKRLTHTEARVAGLLGQTPRLTTKENR